MNNKEYAGIVLQELTHTLSSIDEVPVSYTHLIRMQL